MDAPPTPLPLPAAPAAPAAPPLPPASPEVSSRKKRVPGQRQRNGTTIWVDVELRDKLRILRRGQEDANAVVWRLVKLHGREANAGGINEQLVKSYLLLGRAGDSLNDVAYMVLTHFMNCRGPGGAGTIAGYVEARKQFEHVRKLRESQP